MIQLVNFWTNLVTHGEKKLDDVPDKIKSSVINELIKLGVLTDENIDDVKKAKITEMSIICNEVIVKGFDITLSDKKSHHFSLEVPDQLKISKLNDRANAGVTILPYHADGESCKFYSKEDIMAINTAMENCIEFQVTYFNSLRDYIQSMTDINSICNINYGIIIPEMYQSEVLKALYTQINSENN